VLFLPINKNTDSVVRVEVLTSVFLKIYVFWDVMLWCWMRARKSKKIG
jgi:hypothetical protein